MSVPKYKRSESNMEFYKNYDKLKREVYGILIRDFGLKTKSFTVDYTTSMYKMDDSDIKQFKQLCDKYQIDSFIVEKVPDWIINNWRNEILMIINNMGIEINTANGIYVTNVEEYYCRRNHWNNAIGYLYALMDKLQTIVAFLKVSAGSYENAINIIIKEVNLIKGVRKADNRFTKNQAFNLQPAFNNGAFVFNSYPAYPHAPNYYMNSDTVRPVSFTEMCYVNQNAPALSGEKIGEAK